MKFTDIPLSNHIGLKEADTDSGYVLFLDESPALLNHLGQLHAAVLFGIVETSSAHYLQSIFGEIEAGLIPVIRHVDIKFSKPGHGRIYSKVALLSEANAIIATYKSSGRVSLETEVKLINEARDMLVNAKVQWFFKRV